MKNFMDKYLELAPLIISTLLTIHIIFGTRIDPVSLLIYVIYMVYKFYELLDEFVKNHRLSVNLQYRDYLTKPKESSK